MLSSKLRMEHQSVNVKQYTVTVTVTVTATVFVANLCPTEHVTDWHCPAENAFAMFIQVFHDELFNVHLNHHTHTHTQFSDAESSDVSATRDSAFTIDKMNGHSSNRRWPI